jgi:hypothetical protein
MMHLPPEAPYREILEIQVEQLLLKIHGSGDFESVPQSLYDCYSQAMSALDAAQWEEGFQK